MQLDPKELYQKIEAQLQSQQFHPVYFFHGDEQYLIHQAAQYLKTCALHGSMPDFAFKSFFAEDVSADQILDEVQTLPMMAARKVVWLREFQDISEKTWNQIECLFEKPVDSCVIIITAFKADKRKKYFKALNDCSIAVEFRKPFENQVGGWVRYIAKGYGIEITNEATQLLTKLVGSQLVELDVEIRKLRDFIGERKEVELADVAQIVSQKKEENVFEFCEVLARVDRVRSLQILVDLLDQGQSELGIIALLARHFRILLLLKKGSDEGLAGQKLAAYAQVPSYYLQKYVEQSRIWSQRKLEQGMILLAETDKALKSSPVSAPIWLDNMVLRLTQIQQS